MIQEWTLQRLDANSIRTLGALYLDKDHYCYTVEDAIRLVKVDGETAVPSGLYELQLTVSPRAAGGGLWTPWPDFNLPLVVSVPGFTGIRIHAGNVAADTEGCIIVGMDRLTDGVGSSRVALRRLMNDMKFPSHLTIINPPGRQT